MCGIDILNKMRPLQTPLNSRYRKCRIQSSPLIWLDFHASLHDKIYIKLLRIFGPIFKPARQSLRWTLNWCTDSCTPPGQKIWIFLSVQYFMDLTTPFGFSCGELILGRGGDPNNVKKIPGKKEEHYPDTIGINTVVNDLRVWDWLILNWIDWIESSRLVSPDTTGWGLFSPFSA